jgi:hypothetical protein
MDSDLPTLFTLEVPSQTPDDVTDIIYLQNDTDRTFVATVISKFFTTVDEDSGEVLYHGSGGTDVELAPGQRVRVGDILGWEWDSVLDFRVEFRHARSTEPRRVSYTLRSQGHLRHIDGLGEVCVVPPFEAEVHSRTLSAPQAKSCLLQRIWQRIFART